MGWRIDLKRLRSECGDRTFAILFAAMTHFWKLGAQTGSVGDTKIGLKSFKD
jgi:hypothetical protein